MLVNPYVQNNTSARSSWDSPVKRNQFLWNVTQKGSPTTSTGSTSGATATACPLPNFGMSRVYSLGTDATSRTTSWRNCKKKFVFICFSTSPSISSGFCVTANNPNCSLRPCLTAWRALCTMYSSRRVVGLDKYLCTSSRATNSGVCLTFGSTLYQSACSR